MDRKPLVLDESAAVQQLQQNDDLDIPTKDRINRLEKRLRLLLEYLHRQGIKLPRELKKLI